MADENTIISNVLSSTVHGARQNQPACLVQYNGQSLAKRYLLDQPEMVAGRSPTLIIAIQDQSISRNHAKFTYRGNDVEIEDLNTTNGTFINETRLTRAVILKDGDMVRMGAVLFKFFAFGNLESLFHDKIYRMATIDTTTQIFNKKYLLETLDSEFRISRTYGRSMCLIMYDLDFFKKVNDVHGHNAGDFILKESAQIVKASIRKQDTVGRFGGEEFGIVLPDTDSRTAAELAERIRRMLAAHPFQFEGKVIQQTVSMGVTQLTSTITSPQELIDSADKKLYKSKHAGRNQVTV